MFSKGFQSHNIPCGANSLEHVMLVRKRDWLSQEKVLQPGEAALTCTPSPTRKNLRLRGCTGPLAG